MDPKDEIYNSSNSHSEDDDEEIRCRCGQNVDSGSLMICCDKCEFWQHAECYYGYKRDKMPEKFFCHVCQPKQADMFKYIENEEIKNELLNDWLEYAKKNKKKRKKKKNQEDYNFNTKEVAVLERYWKHYCRNINNNELSENILRAVGILFNCKVSIIHEVFYNMAFDIQQLSLPSLILGVDIKDPYSGWKLKNENIYTKVSENITKPKETSDPNSLDNPLEPFLKVEKVNTWEEKNDTNNNNNNNNQTYIEYGVFSNKAIEPQQLIVEFYGKFTTWDAYRNLKGKLTRPNFRGLVFAEKGLCVDATKHGNISRYLRRSCTPNAKVLEKWIDGKMRLGIFANNVIEIGTEITIPFDYSYGSLRNGLECACGKKESCPVYQWYLERKNLSDIFLEKNKIENIIKEPTVQDMMIPKNTDELDDIILHDSTYQDDQKTTRRNSSKMSREERKIQAIVQTIDRLEEQEKKRTGSPARAFSSTSSNSNNTPLKTALNNVLSTKKNLFPESTTNTYSPSVSNKKPLSLSSQNVNNLSGSGNSRNILSRAKSPSSTPNRIGSSTNNKKITPSSQNKRSLQTSSRFDNPKPKMVGKKAWMNKFLTEENESKSEENNHMEDDSSSIVSPFDHHQGSMDKQQNSPPSMDGNNNNNNNNINNINIHFKKEDENGIITNNNINNNNINQNNIINNNINYNNNINTVNNNNPPQNIDIQLQNASDSSIVESLSNGRESHKRKFEEDNLLNNNNNNSINNHQISPNRLPPLPPNSPPASPPDIGPELPPEQKKKNSSGQEIITINTNTSQDVVNNQIPDNPPSSVQSNNLSLNGSHKDHSINNGISENKLNNFISLNNGSNFIDFVNHQPNGIYSGQSQNIPIDPMKNN